MYKVIVDDKSEYFILFFQLFAQLNYFYILNKGGSKRVNKADDNYGRSVDYKGNKPFNNNARELSIARTNGRLFN